MMSVICCSLLQ